MRKEFKNFCTLTVTNNAKENVDAFYDDCNTARKQPDPYWTILS